MRGNGVASRRAKSDGKPSANDIEGEVGFDVRWCTAGNGNFVDPQCAPRRHFGKWVVVSASSPAKNMVWTGGIKTSSLCLRAYPPSDHVHRSTSQTTSYSSCATD